MTSGATISTAQGRQGKAVEGGGGGGGDDDAALMDFAPGRVLAAEDLASVKVCDCMPGNADCCQLFFSRLVLLFCRLFVVVFLWMLVGYCFGCFCFFMFCRWFF